MHLAQFDVNLLEPTLASAKQNPQEFLKFLFAGNPWDCDCDALKTVQVQKLLQGWPKRWAPG